MSVLIGSAISAGASIIGGIIGGSKARRAKRKAARKLKRMNAKMKELEANRQEIINPYEDMTSLSGMMSNPMANLSVATQATSTIRCSDSATSRRSCAMRNLLWPAFGGLR